MRNEEDKKFMVIKVESKRLKELISELVKEMMFRAGENTDKFEGEPKHVFRIGYYLILLQVISNLISSCLAAEYEFFMKLMKKDKEQDIGEE